MERRSDKHGSRIDEGLKHDTDSIVHGAPVESRAAEAREQEGPADDEPTPDSLLTGEAREGVGDGLTASELKTLTDALDKATQGLDTGYLPLNKELLQKLKNLDPAKLRQLSPEQLANHLTVATQTASPFSGYYEIYRSTTQNFSPSASTLSPPKKCPWARATRRVISGQQTIPPAS